MSNTISFRAKPKSLSQEKQQRSKSLNYTSHRARKISFLNVDKKILLCYPNGLYEDNVSFEKPNLALQLLNFGFLPFKQLKQSEMQSYQYSSEERQSTSVASKQLAVLMEVKHNNYQKSYYEKSMFKLREKQVNNFLSSYQQKIIQNLSETQKKQKAISRSSQEKTMNEEPKREPRPTNLTAYCYPIQSFHLPDNRTGAKAIRYNEQVIVFGGYSNREMKDVPILDLISEQWSGHRETTQVNINFGINFSICLLQDTAYIFGGERRTGGRHNMNLLFRVNLLTIKWEQLVYEGDYIEPRRFHSAAASERYLIVIGGLGQDYLRDFYCIDLHLLKSTLMTPENDELFEQGIAFHECLSISGPTVKLYPDYRRKQTSTLENGIFIYGGKNSSGEIYDKLYLFQGSDLPHTLEIVETFGKPPQKRHSTTLNYSEKWNGLIIFGGTNDQVCFNDCFFLSLTNKNWIQVKLFGKLPVARFSHCSQIYHSKIIVFGGNGNEGFLNYETYILETDIQEISKLNY